MNHNIKGTIFDIHRFALHDGPGIRTTVFLKGCPLHCQWCHNPESISGKPQLGYFADRCTLCGDCASICPNGVHVIANGKHVLDRGKCNVCGLCVDVCPNNALTIAGKEMSVEEVIDVLIKDKIYYDESGGGMTLSGGEPLMQPEFTLAVLQRVKEAGIHTCIDTSGAVSQEVLKNVIDYTDLFLYDYKATDPKQHRVLTGQSNEKILENLQFIYKAGKEIILRCPIIPGMNDDEKHCHGIAKLKETLPDLKAIQIMPYHSTGNSKYERYGLENTVPNQKDTSADYTEQMQSWFNE